MELQLADVPVAHAEVHEEVAVPEARLGEAVVPPLARTLAGATVVGLNPTRGSADLAADIRHADCALIVTDRRGSERLRELAHGLSAERFLLVDDPGHSLDVEGGRQEFGQASAGGEGVLQDRTVFDIEHLHMALGV